MKLYNKRGGMNVGILKIILGLFCILLGGLTFVYPQVSYIWIGGVIGGVFLIYYGIQDLQKFSIRRGKIEIKCAKCGNIIIIPKSLKSKITLCPECNPDIQLKEHKNETNKLEEIIEYFLKGAKQGDKSGDDD